MRAERRSRGRFGRRGATATVHRQLITTENVITTGTFYVGTATTLRLMVTELPTIKIVQKDFAEFSGDFTLVEQIL